MGSGADTPDQHVARPRDPRLDFFRGAGMLIILVAHIPGNAWTLWIPARFGFSDATEIFVFCSGFASALAFGASFGARGWWIGSARILHRMWQVYWAHIGVFLATVAMLAAIDLRGWGARPHPYIEEPYVVPFFEATGETLAALMTLSYVPGLFDILPMYLVILGMIPAVMALRAASGPSAVAAAVVALWFAATLANLAARAGTGAEGGWLWDAAADVGGAFQALNLPSTPDGAHRWFFNPFAWQLVFFTGFAFGSGWLPAPPRSRRLATAAAAVLLLSVPLAWHKLTVGVYLPEASGLPAALRDVRDAILPLHDKSGFGLLRFVHFLALAYLVWLAVGPGGERLRRGFVSVQRDAASRRRRALGFAALAIATAPYAYDAALSRIAPGVIAVLPVAPGPATAGLSVVHAYAAGAVLWHAAPEAVRLWMSSTAPAAITPVLMKVGTQSLAVFMASIPLSQLCGLALDHLGRGLGTTAVVNLAGMALLVGVAYLAGWFKSQPWRRAPASGRASSRAEPSGLLAQGRGGG